MNTQQRIEAYKAVLKQFVKGNYTSRYVCDNLIDYAAERFFTDEDGEFYFTEFDKQKPSYITNDLRTAWWPLDDVKSRRKALRNAIKLAEKLLVSEQSHNLKPIL